MSVASAPPLCAPRSSAMGSAAPWSCATSITAASLASRAAPAHLWRASSAGVATSLTTSLAATSSVSGPLPAGMAPASERPTRRAAALPSRSAPVVARRALAQLGASPSGSPRTLRRSCKRQRGGPTTSAAARSTRSTFSTRWPTATSCAPSSTSSSSQSKICAGSSMRRPKAAQREPRTRKTRARSASRRE